MLPIRFIFYRHLSQEGLDIVSENGQIQDVNILGRKALDVSVVSMLLIRLKHNVLRSLIVTVFSV